MRGSNLERWKPFTEGKHLTTSLQCTYRKQPDYLESLYQGGSLAGASLKPRMPQKERGSASKGLWPGRRERPQSMLGLEQFLSSPDLFAAISLLNVLALVVAQETRGQGYIEESWQEAE